MSPVCSRASRALPRAPATCACAPGQRIRRRARVCYDHLAGDLGVQMLDSMKRQKLVRQHKDDIKLTAEGARFLANTLQISAETLAHPRPPPRQARLAWSERRHH